MLVVMHKSATAEQVDRVLETIREMGLTPTPLPGATRTAIGITGNTGTVDAQAAEAVAEVAAVIQIGARNMQNYSLLRRVGRFRKPILLKRGLSATLEELLMAAEYILAGGNFQVALCERGVRTFADHTRN